MNVRVESHVDGVNASRLEMGMRPKDLPPTQVAMLQEVRRLRESLGDVEEELTSGEVDLGRRAILAGRILSKCYDILRQTVV